MIESRIFGMTSYTSPVTLYRLANGDGCVLELTDLGASIVRLTVPDAQGRPANVVLGYDDPARYLEGHDYLGACVGRVANRIAGATFDLDGRTYHVDRNDGANALHGGGDGFHRRVWRRFASSETGAGAEMVFKLDSAADDMGYPGALEAKVAYRLSCDGRLSIRYEARSDAPTLVNLTNHSYFNLGGEGSGDCLDHELQIEAKAFLPVRGDLIPTGEVRQVRGGAFDFTSPRRLGDVLAFRDDQILIAQGLDHNFCLEGPAGQLRRVARVWDPRSGRRMELQTTEPGLQVYSGNFLDGVIGRGDARHVRHAGFCLETQAYPDAPHHPNFPSIVLRPGAVWRSRTDYVFSAR